MSADLRIIVINDWNMLPLLHPQFNVGMFLQSYTSLLSKATFLVSIALYTLRMLQLRQHLKRGSGFLLSFSTSSCTITVLGFHLPIFKTSFHLGCFTGLATFCVDGTIFSPPSLSFLILLATLWDCFPGLTRRFWPISTTSEASSSSSSLSCFFLR